MDALRVHRVRKGLTQDALAKRVGTDRGMISGYETGKISPSGKRLQELAKALEVSADDIDLGNTAA